MKLVKTASGKQTIKISKKEWESIGKTAEWMTNTPNPLEPKMNNIHFPEPLFNTFEDAVQWVQSKSDASIASRDIIALLDDFIYRRAMNKAKITERDMVASIHNTYSGKDTQTFYNLIQQMEAAVSTAFRENLK